MASAVSSGGAGGAIGVGLQDQVFAWAATHMVAEDRLPDDFRVPGKVTMVGAQTGYALDDVGVLTDTGSYALFQVKAGLGLGEAEDSPLAKAVDQAVEQYISGMVPSGEQGAQRSVARGRDALIICTDSSAPAAVRVDLRSAVRRAGSQPAGTPLVHELNADERKALQVLLTHVRRIWEAKTGGAPSDEQVRGFLRLLHVITVDAGSGEPDFRGAVAALERVVLAGSGPAAWMILVHKGHEAAENKLWVDRAEIVVEFQSNDLSTLPLVAYRPDVELLRRHSQLNAEALGGSTRLPSGTHVVRGISEDLNSALDDGSVLLVGEAGAGKTGLAIGLARGREDHQDVVLLQAADITGPDHIVLTHGLVDVLHAWSGPPAILVIDGLDAVRGSQNRGALIRLVERLRGTRWTVLATVRSFDARYDKALQAVFAGVTVSDEEGQADPRLSGIRHLLVGSLSEDELGVALAASPALATFVSGASVDVRVMLRNPFNLQLADGLVRGNSPVDSERLSAVHTRLGLLALYWEWRVQAEDRTARDAVLERLCRHMLSARDLRAVEQAPVVAAGDSAAVEALLHEGVLTADPGAVPGARRVLAFSHNILFDFAAAMYVLLDQLHPDRLLTELDQDPELPLVARPSLDLLVDHLWEHRSSGAFWNLCFVVAASDHLLASLAFAGRLLALIREADDLNPLVVALTTSQDDSHANTVAALTSQLAGALGSVIVVPDGDVAGAIEPVATLSLRLAEHAETTSRFDLAALAADLLHAQQRRVPLAPGSVGAVTRARAVAALLDACRTAPTALEPVAGSVCRHLGAAIDVDPQIAEALARLISDDAAIKQWAGTVLHLIAQALPALLRLDRTLAIDVCNLVWNFKEQRDEQITFAGGPLLPLRESRSQQAQHGRFVVGLIFGELCSIDLLGAASIFCDVANTGIYPVAPGRDPKGDWPLGADGDTGWLQYGEDLDHLGGSDAAAKMAKSLADHLIRGTNMCADISAVVEALTVRLHNAAAWAVLMQPGNDSVSLGRALLPALASGSLLAHPETHENAAHLLKAFSHGDSSILPATLEAAVRNARTIADAHRMSERLERVC